MSSPFKVNDACRADILIARSIGLSHSDTGYDPILLPILNVINASVTYTPSSEAIGPTIRLAEPVTFA